MPAVPVIFVRCAELDSTRYRLDKDADMMISLRYPAARSSPDRFMRSWPFNSRRDASSSTRRNSSHAPRSSRTRAAACDPAMRRPSFLISWIRSNLVMLFSASGEGQNGCPSRDPLLRCRYAALVMPVHRE